jgi:hypothetical protein
MYTSCTPETYVCKPVYARIASFVCESTKPLMVCGPVPTHMHVRQRLSVGLPSNIKPSCIHALSYLTVCCFPRHALIVFPATLSSSCHVARSCSSPNLAFLSRPLTHYRTTSQVLLRVLGLLPRVQVAAVRGHRVRSG